MLKAATISLIFGGSLLASDPALSADPLKQLGIIAPSKEKPAGKPLPGFYRPAHDSADAWDRVGSALVYKTTFDKYSCIKITEHWPDEAYAKTSVRKDANRPAITSFMQVRQLEPALYCNDDGLYTPNANQKGPQRPTDSNPVMKEPQKGVVSLHYAHIYDRTAPGGRTLAVINKGDCVLVKQYIAATAHSQVVIRNPRDPQGALIEGYVVRLQTNRARNCTL